MVRLSWSLPLVALLFAASAVAVPAAPPFFGKSKEKEAKSVPAEQVKWAESLQAAHKAALAENKPILIVFGADWCVFCKKLEEQTLNTPEMAKYINESFIAVHLDMDKNERVAEILEVESLPCSVVLTPEANVLGRIEGFYKTGPFQRKLVDAQSRFHQVRAASQTSESATK